MYGWALSCKEIYYSDVKFLQDVTYQKSLKSVDFSQSYAMHLLQLMPTFCLFSITELFFLFIRNAVRFLYNNNDLNVVTSVVNILCHYRVLLRRWWCSTALVELNVPVLTRHRLARRKVGSKRTSSWQASHKCLCHFNSISFVMSTEWFSHGWCHLLLVNLLLTNIFTCLYNYILHDSTTKQKSRKWCYFILLLLILCSLISKQNHSNVKTVSK